MKSEIKSLAKSTAIALFCVTPLLSSATLAATDSEQFSRCKQAAQSQYGDSTTVKLMRVKRYKGAVTVKLRVRSDQENDGGRFVSVCTIDRAGALSLVAAP